MKKLFAMFGLLLLCSACSDKDDSASAPKVTLSSESPSVLVILDGGSALVDLPDYTEGGDQVVIAINANCEVAAQSNAEWCQATIEANKLIIKALTNTDVDRRAEIMLTGAGVRLGKIIVNQLTISVINVEKTTVEVPIEGITCELAVSTNQQGWSASTDADWITVGKKTGKLLLTIPDNNSSARTGIVTLTAGTGVNVVSTTVTVNQAANALILEYTVPAAGSVILPLGGSINCQINWGDGNEESIATTSLVMHTYEQAGVYEVSIIGSVPQLSCGSIGHTDTSRSYLTAVKAWGNLGLTSMENAFYKCNNLASVPENTRNSFKNVTTFKYAFWNSGLESIPASLFKGCSELTLVTFCFSNTQITEIPESLFDEAPNITDFNTCFSSNTKLTRIPATLFAKAAKASNMSACFQLCLALTEIPAGLFRNVPAPKMNDMFYGCKALTKVPDELFAGCSESTTFANCFQNCTALTSVGNNVFKDCTKVTSYSGVFFGCTALESVPAGIFDDSKKVTNFNASFRNNSKLVSESPYTVIDGKKVHLYERQFNTAVFTKPTSFANCFYNCTALSDWSEISTNYATWTK